MGNKAPSTYYLKQRRHRALIGLRAAQNTLIVMRLKVMALDLDRFATAQLVGVLTNELHKLEDEIAGIQR